MKNLSKLVIFTLILSMFSFVPVVDAAGVVITSTPNIAAATTATDIVLSWTATGSTYLDNDTINFALFDQSGTASTATLVAHATPEVDIDNDANADGSFAYGAGDGTATYTISTAANVNGTGLSFNIGLPSLAAGNYSMSVTDSRNGDFGSVLIYVGDDNDVNVTADVQPMLSFVIRTSTDAQNLGDDNEATPAVAATTETPNNCPLGMLTTGAVSTCSYRLKVSTNASDGYTVQIASDGDLRRTGSGDVVDADDLDPVGEATVTAGAEGYGIGLAAGATSTGATVTEAGNFATDDSSVPTSATDLYSAAGANVPSATDTTNTALVTHSAAIDSNTGTGHYTQVVTYTVTGAF